MSKGMTNEDLKVAVEAMAGQINDAVGTIREAIAEFDIRVEQAEREGYVGDLFRTDYTVSGRGPFPIDMLRYAVSWPADEADARAIEESLEQADNTDPFVIRLTKYHRDATPQLCDDRWESKFKWKVLRNNTIETTRS